MKDDKAAQNRGKRFVLLLPMLFLHFQYQIPVHYCGQV